MKCPLCGSIDTGKVGTGQYYCWRCLVEFNMTGPRGFTAYYVDEEGSLLVLDTPENPDSAELSVGDGVEATVEV